MVRLLYFTTGYTVRKLIYIGNLGVLGRLSFISNLCKNVEAI